MEMRCLVQEKVSEKTGKKYYVLYIPELEKQVFLDSTEVKLLSLLNKLGSNSK